HPRTRQRRCRHHPYRLDGHRASPWHHRAHERGVFRRGRGSGQSHRHPGALRLHRRGRAQPRRPRRGRPGGFRGRGSAAADRRPVAGAAAPGRARRDLHQQHRPPGSRPRPRAGSALTGAGVPDLLTTLPRLMPWARPATRSLSGIIYKIEHGDHGTLAHCRVFGGELRVRHRATVAAARPEVITSLERSTPDGWVRVSVARAGDVVRIRGIGSARTGGWVGEAIPGRVTRQFPAPALESVVEPVNPAGPGRLFPALRELAEADPLINLRVNAERGEIAVSLYGEVQKEVIADLLARQFGVAVTFRPTVTVHIERIAGTGASSALISEKATPYLATLGFRVGPAPAGSGLACDLEVERGSMPPAFCAATWEGVRAGLAQGP